MNSTKIIIVGYPKSGTTWITRLVAELLQCPVAGFWAEPDNPEIAIEGAGRQSPYNCYKSHHQYRELSEFTEFNDLLPIYVARDPRDVALSGSHTLVQQSSASDQAIRLKRMIAAVLQGDKDVHYWCRVSWKDHVLQYLEQGVFYLRYEDMLDEPTRESIRLLRYIGLERNAEQIDSAIEKQSFQAARERFLQRDDRWRAHFLRVGTKEQWKSELTPEQLAQFDEALGPMLIRLGYTPSSNAP